MTEKLFRLEKNTTTQEEIYREYTPEEYAQAEANAIAYAEQQAIVEAEAARISALKDSARAKLVSGQPLTEEEAKTLVI